MAKRKYIVASVGKHKQPIQIFSNHRVARAADKKAYDIAKQKAHLIIGVFGYYNGEDDYNLLRLY